MDKPSKTKDMARLMGECVEVVSVLRRATRSSGIAGEWLKVYEQRKLPVPRTGWIVGFATLTGGIVLRNGEGELNSYRVQKRFPALRVVFWPTRAPVYVSLDMATHEPMGRIFGPPVSDSKYHAKMWGTVETDRLRAEIKDWPRDAKGHWMKKGVSHA